MVGALVVIESLYIYRVVSLIKRQIIIRQIVVCFYLK